MYDVAGQGEAACGQLQETPTESLVVAEKKE